MSKKKTTKPENEIDAASVARTREQDRAALRRKVSVFYDLQRLRLQTAGRTYERADGTEIQLHEYDVQVLNRRAKELELAEKHALSDVEEHLKTIPFYRDTLSDKERFRGVGPTMAGVILSSFDIHREDTVSKMWAFAGLRPMPAFRCKACNSVVDLIDDLSAPPKFAHRKFAPKRAPVEGAKVEEEKGSKAPVKCTKTDLLPADVYESAEAQHPIKGQKLNYNSFLRAKLCGVLGPVILKSTTRTCSKCKTAVKKVPAKTGEKLESEMFEHRDADAPCSRRTMGVEDIIKLESPLKKFYDNYKARITEQGKGRSDAHRHAMAIRYMIKMLLLEIHREWRKAEGLPVREPYAVEYLHGGRHAGESVTMPAKKPVQAPRSEREERDAEIEAELGYAAE